MLVCITFIRGRSSTISISEIGKKIFFIFDFPSFTSDKKHIQELKISNYNIVREGVKKSNTTF